MTTAAGRRLVGASLVALVLGVVGTGVFAAQAQAQVAEPIAVVSAYEMARNRGDFDMAVSYFADDGTLSQRNAVYTGREEIRRYLEASAGRGRFVVMSNRRLNGNRLAWTERPAGQNINSIEVTVEAVVQDGRIKALVYNGAVPALRSDTAADGRAQLPALVGLASVVLLLSSVILVASAGLWHSTAPQSRLRGRMLHDLQVWRAARTASG
ncbi:MAG TPA: nuclear transport factor 2 family protein [Chloroflexota bacterium]|nr:nuclear transport factor 2 family protein [Chloroflexota bacterium]